MNKSAILVWIVLFGTIKVWAQQTWEWITPPQYKIIGNNGTTYSDEPDVQDGLVMAWLDEKQPGYIDIATGKWYKLPYIKNSTGYDNVGYGLFRVSMRREPKAAVPKNGLIDRNGKWILQPGYPRVQVLNADLLNFPAIRLTNKAGEIITNEIHTVGPFSEGLAAAYKSGASSIIGFIDETGKWAIDPMFEKELLPKKSYGANFIDYEHFVFSEGLCPLKQNGKYGFIDKSGEFIIEPLFEDVAPLNSIIHLEAKHPFKGHFSEGLATVKMNGIWGFIDKTGKWVIEPQYTVATPFIDGVAMVCRDKLWMYINKSNEVLFHLTSPITLEKHKPVLYSFLGGIGMAVVPVAEDVNHSSKTYGTALYTTICINQKGETVIPINSPFDKVGSFTGNVIMLQDGVAKAYKNGKWGLIKFKLQNE